MEKMGKQFIMTSHVWSVTCFGVTKKTAAASKLEVAEESEEKRESERKNTQLALDSLGLFLTWGRGKRQMSDKFWRLRGVLIVSLAPRCVMSCSLTGSVRRGDETETSIPLWVPRACQRCY